MVSPWTPGAGIAGAVVSSGSGNTDLLAKPVFQIQAVRARRLDLEADLLLAQGQRRVAERRAWLADELGGGQR
jgi:hypothetical protein